MSLAGLIEYLNYDIFRCSLSVSLLSGIVCSAVGVYVYLKKMSFIGAGLAHVAFAGIAFGLLLGFYPMLWAFSFALFSAVLIWFFSQNGKLTYDATIGILFSTSMGLAVIFLGFSGKYRSEALSYLFGSPLLASWKDALMLLFILAFLLSMIFLYRRELFLVIFSQEIAKASGIEVEALTLTLNVLIALSVVASMKAVGAILVFSLLIVPPASAYLLCRSLNSMFVLSVLFGITSALLGTFLSFLLDLPSGATITLVSFVIFILAYSASKLGWGY